MLRYILINLSIWFGILIIGTFIAAIIDVKYGFYGDMKNGFKYKY